MDGKKPVRKVMIAKILVRVDTKDTTFVQTMKIGGVTLEIQISILTPINWFDGGEEVKTIMTSLFGSPKEVEVIRSDYLQMAIFRDGQEISLEPKEWVFFASMTIGYIEGFMNRPETRAIDKAAIDLSREEKINLFSACKLESRGHYTVFEEEIAMLESPKFGCKFNS